MSGHMMLIQSKNWSHMVSRSHSGSQRMKFKYTYLYTYMYALALVCILLLCRVYTGIHCACSKTTVMVLSHRSIGHRSALVHHRQGVGVWCLELSWS